MVVCIWSGYTKPSVTEYLKPFVAEMKDLLSKEMFMNSHRVNIKLGRFIGDTPARSFMKGMHA